MLDLFLQFALELIRALLVDELSGHVRRRVARWLPGRGAGCRKRAILSMHRRNRERLLNRLLTGVEDDL
jgi:hypothetical protein